jgi:CRISPR/Cas system CSM-associated protein Csm4 (group 5 of RAMP superfamily)
VKGALRLLADSGFGGERSRGWGRSEQPEFVEGTLPDLVLPRTVTAGAAPDLAPGEAAPEAATPEAEAPAETPAPGTRASAPDPGTRHWLLSLFSPAAEDTVEWDKGNYAVVSRGGRIESAAGYGELKKQLNMICEGSVLVAGEALRGAAPDVAPNGFPHPVYRAGFAVSIPIPRLVLP